MNPRLVQAIARSSSEDDALGETRAARRAARLRTNPTFAAQLLRSILATEEAQRRAPRPRTYDSRH